MVKAKNYIVNPLAAPKELNKFKKWHKLACKNDPLNAEERFVALGGKLPVKKK